MNFDLDDGRKPVSFTLKPDDCERFMEFMSNCSAQKRQLEEAMELVNIINNSQNLANKSEDK